MKKHIFALTLILLLGAALRLYNIGWGLPDETHRWPYHADEKLGLLCIKSMNPATGDFSPHNFRLGSFYVYSLGFWLKSLSYLGIITTVNSEDFYRENIEELRKIYLSGRILTVLMGIVSIFLLYILGKLFYDRRVGLMAAFLIAILPFSVIHSHYMASHIQFAALCLLSLIFCGLIFKDGRLRWYVLFGLSTGLAIGTYWFLGVLLIVALLATHSLRRPEKSFGMFAERNFITAIGITILAFFISSPYVFITPGEFISEWQYVLHHYHHFGMENMFSPFLKVLPYGFGRYLFWLSIAGILFALVKNRKEDKILLIWAGAYYLAVTFSGSGYLVHRFSPLIYIAVLFAARFVFVIMDLPAKKKMLKLSFQIFLSIIILSSFFYTLALLRVMSVQDTRTMAHCWINDNIPPGSRILIDHWSFVPHLDTKRYNIIIGGDRESDHTYYITHYGDCAGMGKEYILTKSFIERPAFSGMVFNDSKAPRDMKHANPEIYIYERR